MMRSPKSNRRDAITDLLAKNHLHENNSAAIRSQSQTAMKVNNRIDFGYEMNIRAVAASSRISGMTSSASEAAAER